MAARGTALKAPDGATWSRAAVAAKAVRTHAVRLGLAMALLGAVAHTATAGPAGKTRYPTLALSNGLIRAEVYIPGRGAYYRGPRFDWSGMIARVTYKGHTFFRQWKTPHDPLDQEDGIGTAEEFGCGFEGMPSPMDYRTASVGQTFLKIGVGLLLKVRQPTYLFTYPYRIIKAGRWRIRRGKNWLGFRQVMSDGRGWGYLYRKRITLPSGSAEFIISHYLKNTGHRTICTTTYCHNMVAIDNDPIGPDYKVEFPFVAKLVRNWRGLVRSRGKTITFRRAVAKGEEEFSDLRGFRHNVADNEATVINTKTGAEIKIFGNRPLLAFHFFVARTVVCPENFIRIELKPGQAATWTNVYQLGVR